MAVVDDLKKSGKHAKLVTELEQLCNRDLHVEILKVAVASIEAARKAKPKDNPLSECFNADVSVATDELTASGKLDAAKDVLARYSAACPEAK
jgi:hypothetical protein